MKVSAIPIDNIIIGERFRKDYGDVESLAQTIKEKGLLQPIIVDADNNLLDGGRRLAACKLLGMEKIPANKFKIHDELDLREIELLANITKKDMAWHERCALESRIFKLRQESDPQWSQRKQATLLNHSQGTVHRRMTLGDALEIPELGSRLKSCSSEDEAWKSLMRLQEDIERKLILKKVNAVEVQELNQTLNNEGGEHSEQGEQSDDPKQLDERYSPDTMAKAFVKTRAVNAYQIGDALAGMERHREKSMHFAEVDPPYGVELNKIRERNKNTESMDRYTEIPKEEYPEFLNTTAKLVYKTLIDDAFCVWWFGSSWYHEVFTSLNNAGFKVNPIPAIWVKNSPGVSQNPDINLGSAYEPFLVARKGNPKLWKPGRGNVFTYSAIPPAQKIHPTEKPGDLMDEILTVFCVEGYRILCPFMGSGATIRSAFRNNMWGWGWDLDKTFKDRFLVKVYEDKLKFLSKA